MRAVTALGLGWGAAHVELRLDGPLAKVIEVNPRLAGGMIPELVRRACGVDLVRAQVLAALGRPAAPTRGMYGRASIRFLTADRDGILAPDLCEPTARAHRVPGVVEAAFYRAPGEPVGPATDFRGRLGHVIALADHPLQAAAAADRAVAALAEAVSYTALERQEALT